MCMLRFSAKCSVGRPDKKLPFECIRLSKDSTLPCARSHRKRSTMSTNISCCSDSGQSQTDLRSGGSSSLCPKTGGMRTFLAPRVRGEPVPWAATSGWLYTKRFKT